MSDVSVKFGAVDNGLSETIIKIKDSLSNLESQTQKTSSSIGASFMSMTKAGAGLAVGFGAVKGAFELAKGTAESFGAALDMGGRLADLSERTGETAGKLLILERAFTNNGMEAENVGTSINKLQKFIAEAGDESSAQAKKLRALGITMADLAGKTPTEQLGIFATAIGKITDNNERAAMSMEFFSKSGGKMLPLLRNFSGELAAAQVQLGSLPGIMDQSSKMFDDISDNLTVIKGKFTEFAAGILSRVAPALQYFSDALTKIDAAGLGQRLADAFIGAQSAMKGFEMAMQAVKAGDLALAFEAACASIRLQFKQTANETYRNMVAGFIATKDFLIEVLGPGSDAYTIIKNSFTLLGQEITMVMGKGILSIVDSIPSITDALIKVMKILSPFMSVAIQGLMDEIPQLNVQISSGLKENMAVLENEMKNTKNQMANAASTIGDDFARAGKAFPKAFEAAYDESNTIYDLSKDLIKIAEIKKKIDAESQGSDERAAEAAATRAAVSDAINEKKRKELDLEGAISKAKADGNVNLQIQLEGQREYNRALEKAIKLGLSESEARAQAAAAQENFLKNQQNLSDAKRKDLELENQIARAKADGNTQLQIQLEGQREYNKMLEKALKLGMSEADARKQAEVARLLFIKIQEKSQEAAHQRQMARLKEELAISEQLLKNIEKARKDADVTKDGTLTKQYDAAMASGNYDKAERIAKRIQQREEDQELRGVGKNRDRRSVQDMAKDAGIDRIGKTEQELKDELRRRKNELPPGKGGKTEEEGKKGGKDGKGGKEDAGKNPAETALDAIKTATEAIKSLVESLDKKLPQNALGV